MRVVDIIARVGETSPYTHFVYTIDDLKDTAKRLDRMKGLTIAVGGIKGRIARVWYDKEKKALFAEITVGESDEKATGVSTEKRPDVDNPPSGRGGRSVVGATGEGSSDGVGGKSKTESKRRPRKAKRGR